MDIKTIRHISRTNCLLRPQDIASIRKVGEQCQQDLTTWVDKIEATKILLSTLESTVQETKKDIVLCAALSSVCHVRRLPSELLSLVFSFACTGDKLDLFFKRRNRPPTALTLVRVCKYWRDIALGTRSVWSHPIIFDKERRLRSILLMEEEEEMYGRQVQEIVKLYGSNLSHVHLHYDRSFSLRRIVNEVFDNQRHLVSFQFFGEGNFMFQGKAGVRNFDMPLLEELLISSSHWYDAKVRVRIPFKLPNLSRLFLLNPDTSGFFVDRFLLPWRQITHLSFGSPYNQYDSVGVQALYGCDLLRLLTKLPALSSLHLTNVLLLRKDEGEDSAKTSLSPVILHHLKSLEIHDKELTLLRGGEGYTGERHIPFFSCVVTPSLERFDLLFSIRSADGLHPLTAFLRFTSSLRRIRLGLFKKHDFLGLNGFPQPAIVRLAGDSTFFAHLDATTLASKKDQIFVKLGEVMQAPRKGWLDQDLWTNGLVDRHFALKGFAPRSKTVNTSLWNTDSYSDDKEDCGGSEDSTWDDSDEEDGECGYESEASECEDRDEIGLHPYTGIENRIRYDPDDLVSIKGLFKLLSDPQLNADAERQVYIAI